MPGPYSMELHHDSVWKKTYTIPFDDVVDALIAQPGNGFSVDPLDRPDTHGHIAKDEHGLILVITFRETVQVLHTTDENDVLPS